MKGQIFRHIFLLTHPVWDVTLLILYQMTGILFLLTHPVWDVTISNLFYLSIRHISTHTSRVGCDFVLYRTQCFSPISTHTSRVGCDWEFLFHIYNALFLLTHPVWDVTGYRVEHEQNIRIISTHTSRVGCDLNIADLHRFLRDFYSHIPCGMWLGNAWQDPGRVEFLLTHPVWDVTMLSSRLRIQTWISTHTSRVGCDP